MIILNNLFSIFDPSCFTAKMSWFTILTPTMIMILALYSKLTILNKMTISFLSKEFSQGANNKGSLNLSFFMSMFSLILLFNLTGLMPFSFTITAQIAITFPLATITMVSIWTSDWLFKPMKALAHLCPKGAPLGLAPFLVMIELVSSIIRPITLSVRLTANMMAGHLLLALLFNTFSLPIAPTMISISMILLMLELAVSAIQAYVFSMLITLYKSEVYEMKN